MPELRGSGGHVCGLKGYSPAIDPPCPGCADAARTTIADLNHIAARITGIQKAMPLGPLARVERGIQDVLVALPPDAKGRKDVPLCTGVLDYFPAALAEVARVSKAGNDQHNPGQPLHWARGKSADHADCVARHLTQRGTVDVDGQRHTAKAAWRMLALLQEELEAEAGFKPGTRDVVAPQQRPPWSIADTYGEAG